MLHKECAITNISDFVEPVFIPLYDATKSADILRICDTPVFQVHDKLQHSVHGVAGIHSHVHICDAPVTNLVQSSWKT
jgi:hypothetical protein